MVPRLATPRLIDRVAAFRVVVVNGPRQSGKTTLLRLFQQSHGGSFRTLDDAATLAAARADPTGFASHGATPRIVDEVHRGGDALVLAVKRVVDEADSRGLFVLSGSTRFLTVPTLSESLAGRAVFVDLWPFTMAERHGVPGDFCDRLFEGPAPFLSDPPSPWDRNAYAAATVAGGYPEAVALDRADLRGAWFDGYLNTVILRDVGSFAQVRHAEAVPRLLAMLAARSGGTTVLADLATGLQLDQATARNYLTYLETVFLTARIPPWSSNLTARQVKTPKTYVTDPGLAAHLLQVDAEALATPGSPTAGPVIETFVHAELSRLLATGDLGATLYFYRDHDGREVDFVLEKRNGRLVGIEVKASSTVRATDFRHLRWLRDALGDRFTGGYVVHLGSESLAFGEKLAAIPLSAMWHHAR
jgi:hypothetical protein